MARMVNLYEAKTHLSELVERAATGEEIIIAKAGRPRARLMPLAEGRRLREPGDLRGKLWIAEDFDELPADVLAGFHGDVREPEEE